jgi:hypothetical protein
MIACSDPASRAELRLTPEQLISAESGAPLTAWVGVYQEGAYTVSVFEFGEQTLARVRAEGSDWSEDLLARLRQTDAQTVALLFQNHGPAARKPRDFVAGAQLLRISKDSKGAALRWAALTPFQPPSAPPVAPLAPLTLAQVIALDSPSLSDLLRVPDILQRLDALLGARRKTFDEYSARRGSLTRSSDALSGVGYRAENVPQKAGLLYDTRSDELHVFLYDPDCRGHLDVFSEKPAHFSADIRAWVQDQNDAALPLVARSRQ